MNGKVPGSQVGFPVIFHPGDRLVIPAPKGAKQDLVITVKATIEFKTVSELYEYCADNPESSYFSYTLRPRPS